jgi:hypothetical protein
VAEFFIIVERFVVITRQLQAIEVLSKLPTMNDNFLVKQLKLYFKNSSRIPTQLTISMLGAHISGRINSESLSVQTPHIRYIIDEV